ncbi:MAG: GNAT family N-acetyltransferase [Actinobacteria bacterium]|nr:GNAT family N-acetyltransferase [Actinomycetota bacterium]
MEGLQIREALLSDAEGIAKVHVHAWQEAYVGLVPDFFLQSLSVEERTATWVQNIENSPPKTHILVAELDNRIVGFVSVGANRESGPSDQGEIFAIYVDPEIQGRGIGATLMKVGIQALRNESFATGILWVLEGNLLTRTWYESHGWKTDGKTKEDSREGFLLKEVRYGIDLDQLFALT